MSHQLVSIVVDFIRSFIRIIGFRLHHAQAFSPTLNREIEFRGRPSRGIFFSKLPLGARRFNTLVGVFFVDWLLWIEYLWKLIINEKLSTNFKSLDLWLKKVQTPLCYESFGRTCGSDWSAMHVLVQ